MLGDDIAPIALNQPLEAEPGTQFDYNSINPQNLGLILQRATGKRYAQYLSDALWSRIGATDAYVVLDSEAKRIAHFFCCLNATARSWLQVGLLHLTGGVYNGEQVVPAELDARRRDALAAEPELRLLHLARQRVPGAPLLQSQDPHQRRITRSRSRQRT